MDKFNFTKVKIDGLPLPTAGNRAYYYDFKVRGLGIRITSTGNKTFISYRKFKGRPECITIGRYPDITIEQARGKASEINARFAKGENPGEDRRLKKAEMTLRELFDEYMERHSRPNKKTWDEDLSKFNQYLTNNEYGYNLASKKISEITRSDMANLHSKISKHHRITANRVLALVSSVYGWAIKAGLWDKFSPTRGIMKNKENSRDRFLQPEEFPKFFKALAEEPNKIMRDYIYISLFTGARRANVLEMKWKDIGFERAEWHIPETKTGIPHIVSLVPEAINILTNMKRNADVQSEYVFPGKNGGHLEEPKRGWQRVLKRAGIKNLRIHDLRRTLGSWQAITGASLAIIGKSLAHKNVATTAIYARLIQAPVRESMKKAVEAMYEAGGIKPVGEVIRLDAKKKR